MVRVYSYAESPDRFAPGVTLVLMDGDGGPMHVKVQQSLPHKQLVRLSLAGIATREQAEALAGRLVFCEKKDLPPLEPDTYYWNDLIGMSVYSVDDEYLGKVDHIIPTGANDVYVVKTPADFPVEEILLPAIASVILEVDVGQGRMRVELPEGLI